MNSYNPYGDQMSLDMRVSAIMKRVYFKMFLALLVTAATAWGVSQSLDALVAIFKIRWVLLIGELGIVLWLSARLMKMQNTTATLLFYVFAIVNGLTLSAIFVAYSPEAIAKTFLITAGTFGAMSVYGYFTNRDLTKIGTFLIMALFGLIIACLVNMFFKSTQLDWIISIAGVLIFLGLTAWDTQQTKRIAETAPDEMVSKLGTMCALNLYLDFVNLFLYLLRIFGSRD